MVKKSTFLAILARKNSNILRQNYKHWQTLIHIDYTIFGTKIQILDVTSLTLEQKFKKKIFVDFQTFYNKELQGGHWNNIDIPLENIIFCKNVQN